VLILRVFLLRLEEDRILFYSEADEKLTEADKVASPRRGVPGWVERKYLKLQKVLTESEEGIGLQVRRIWEWLHRHVGIDESILMSLRHGEKLELHYPADFSSQEALESWSRYLSHRYRKHLLWLIADGLMSPLTLLLAPFPGPNVIGYWLVYRSVCHLLAAIGIRNARKKSESLRLIQEPQLDGYWLAPDESRIKAVTAALNLHGLHEYLALVGSNAHRVEHSSITACSHSKA
jgi:hypothetical protein